MKSGTTFALQNTAYSTNVLLRNTITTIIQLSIGIYSRVLVENAASTASCLSIVWGLSTGVKLGDDLFLRQFRFAADKNQSGSSSIAVPFRYSRWLVHS